MTTILDNKKRDVIPRWRDFHTTVAIGELKSSPKIQHKSNILEADPLLSKLYDWQTHKTIPYAIELVGAAYAFGRLDEATTAARFLLEQAEDVSDVAKSLAQAVLNQGDAAVDLMLATRFQHLNPELIFEQIKNLKRRLREEPRNAIAYVDLAYAYTLLDQKIPAENAINIALKLNSNNRFILRSAARYFIHFENHDRAHEILRKSEATKFDTWLLAAEIAVASAIDASSRYAKKGQQTLLEGKHSPLETTELASALGTLELRNGKKRDGRKLFRQALISPTENSVAQAEWVSQHLVELEFFDVNNFEEVPFKHEAQAWEYFFNGQWNEVVSESRRWFQDQPFSSRPAMLGSHVAATILGDYQESVNLLKQGLISNQDDIGMLNNLAFSYASLGQVREAQETLDKVNFAEVSAEAEVALTATQGLIEFRSGRIIEGRAKYLQAIELSQKYGQSIRAAARIYYAREELLAKTKEAEKARELALEAAKGLNDVGILKTMERELNATKAENYQP